jgi:hypothetical protein
MNPELVLSIHTTLLVSAFLSTLTLHPELQRSVDRPAARFRLWYERLKQALRPSPPDAKARRFWEIDMTEFEP